MNQTNYGPKTRMSESVQKGGAQTDDAPQSLAIDLSSASSAGRDQLETCITHAFDRHFKAQINHFLPYLLSLSDCDQLGGVVGIRPAGSGDLFLERYLGSRVEQAISRVARQPIDREQIVEIGNLAAAVPGTARLLFGLLAVILDRSGMRWVACTATPQVSAMLKRLNFSAYTLCEAEAEALGGEADAWGSYYTSRPKVVFGDTRIAAALALENPAMAHFVDTYSESIEQIVSQLRQGKR